MRLRMAILVMNAAPRYGLFKFPLEYFYSQFAVYLYNKRCAST